ncbi:MAG: hypothetical protein GY717_00005, partial [Rhodobacteraceae bacterium]|nr:hypothetical protein [Paracoccaceae bacterium]
GEAPLTQRERVAPLVHPFLGVAQASPLPSWQATIPNQAFAAVLDHRIQGMAVFPGAAFVEAFVAAGQELAPDACFSLADINFIAMLELPPGESVYMRTSTGNDRTLTVHASGIGEDAEWVQHASARLVTVPYRNQDPDGDLAGLDARCPNRLAREAIYADLSQRGLEYGPAFTPIRSLGLGDDELIAELDLPETAAQDDFLLHPVLVDGCLQALVAFSEANAAAVPVSIGRVVFFDRLPRRVVCHGRVTDRHSDGLTAELTIMDLEGRVLTRLHDIRAQALGWVNSHQDRTRPLFHQWHWQPLGERQSEVEQPLRLWKAPAKPADPTGMKSCLELLDEVKGCIAGGEARLAVVTRAAQRVVDSDVVDPAARALWGAARVARNEFPDLGLILLDCDEGDVITPWLSELEPGGEYALRGAQLYRHRLQAESSLSPFLSVAEPGTGFALQLGQPGQFSSLHYRRVRRRAPGAGEIEVGIRYVGLNFKDVLKAMGRLSHAALKGTFFGYSLGMDCAGVVERVGADVQEFVPGDLVICCAAQGTFR